MAGLSEGQEVIILRGEGSGRRARVLAVHDDGKATVALAGGRTLVVESWKLAKADQPDVFRTAWDVDRYLSYGGPGRKQGWREGIKDPHGHFYNYLKRVGGVWFELSVPVGTGREVYLRPSTYPKGPNAPKVTDKEAWDEAYKRLTSRLSTDGLTMRNVEDEMERIVGVYKEIAGGRSRRDTTRWTYRNRHTGDLFEGAAAVEQWKKDVEEILQREIDANPSHDWSTESLVGDVLQNYGCQINWAPRETMARSIRTILDAMARAGKIVKDTNKRNDPRWLSKL